MQTQRHPSLRRGAPRSSALVTALLLAGPAFAQTATPPDAGQMLRELQRAPAPAPRASATLIIPADADVSADPGQRFLVKALRVEGAQGIAQAELQALVADMAGTEASLDELRQAAQRITRLYRERGYVVARAFLPAQEIRDGIVVIRVLEGSLNSTSIDNRSIVRQGVLEQIVRSQGLEGQPLRAATTDRMLLLMADLPAMGDVSGSLRPGQRVGTSDLLVTAAAGRARDGEISVDNHGNRYTGQARLNGRVNFNSPLDIGDRLGLRATVTEEKLLFGQVAYDLPVNGDGLRAGASLSSSRYELGQEFAALDASGTARAATAYASYPVVRGLNQNIWLAGSAEYRVLRDDVKTTGSTTKKNARVASVEAYGDLADALGAGGYSTWRAAGTFGDLQIDTPAASAIDALGPNTAGGYRKLQVTVTRLQSIDPKTVVSVAAAGQLASKNLDSSEKFVLGGPYGVRAYPQGEGAGDEGWLVNVELRRYLTPGLQASLFHDVGQVKFSDAPYAVGRNKQLLRGSGVGLTAEWAAFTVRASVAWRHGEAAVTAPDHRARAWMAAGWRF